MTTAVSRGLNMLCVMFKIRAFLIVTICSPRYLRIGTLLTCGSTCMTASRGEVWVHKTSLTVPLIMEVSVPCQQSEQSWPRTINL